MWCRKSLPDVIHTSMPDLSKYEKLIDLFPIVLGCIVIYLSFVLHPKMNVKELLFRITALILLRTITTRVTILPSPICKRNASANAIGGCHDCIYSLHTALMLLFAYYIQKCLQSLRYPLLLYSLIGSIFIVCTRSHYSIDVLVAWIIVFALIK